MVDIVSGQFAAATTMQGDTGNAPKFAGRIGLIGGLAFRAGVHYYDRLVHCYATHQKPLDLVLCHADVGKVLNYVAASDRQGLGLYLGSLANSLFDAGAKLVAVTAVAPHLAIREMAKVARGPVVNILETIDANLCARQLLRVAVFGNRAVIQSNVFGAVREGMAASLEPSLVDEIHNTYSDIALHGKRGTELEWRKLSAAAHHLIDKHGVQAIVLAGTDLSSFYADRKPDYPYLDVAEMHVQQIVMYS